jgi:hypothetical protein
MTWRDFACILWLVFITAVAVILLCVAYRDYKVCDANGGTFVRGLIWFTCVEGMK